MIGFDLEYDLRNCFWGSNGLRDIYILQTLEYMDSVFKPTHLDSLSKRMKFLEYMDSVFVYKTFIWGQHKGSKRGILVE